MIMGNFLFDKNHKLEYFMPYIEVSGYGQFTIVRLEGGYYLLSKSLILDLAMPNGTPLTIHPDNTADEIGLNYMLNRIFPYLKEIDKDFDYGTAIEDFIDEINNFPSIDLCKDTLLSIKNRMLKTNAADDCAFLETNLLLYMIDLFNSMSEDDVKLFKQALQNIQYRTLYIDMYTSIREIKY